ncbi:MAG TPA: gliding motility-associated ABC transporter ATP-binding subunit GldA [Bacteroidia bacterium]|jgi:ABC-2 type transport system ATP-binding protein|nr:gliding motility-associated ABC transporter ATP-binding subunit GldA [Bacteroidia bacterium]
MSVIVEHITKMYGEQKALDDVSFNIKSGEVVGFLGPNGAGKSTMMKIITCFLPQTSGKASVCGFDVSEQSLEVRENVGYLAEHNPLYLDMYVKEYLSFIAGLHHISDTKKRIEEMVAITGLKDEQKKKIGALSKGYRQRVGLAQAMIHNPKVLILDEPTSGLDPNQLQEIRNLIIQIGKEKTVILSTHIMQEVEAVCDRVMIINKGKIVADKATRELKTLEGGYAVITIEFDKEPDLAQLKKIDGVYTITVLGPKTLSLHVTLERDVRTDIFNYAVAAKLAVLTIQKEEKKLEDVFKDLTQQPVK